MARIFVYPIRSPNHYTAAGIFSSSSTILLNTSNPPCQNAGEVMSNPDSVDWFMSFAAHREQALHQALA